MSNRKSLATTGPYYALDHDTLLWSEVKAIDIRPHMVVCTPKCPDILYVTKNDPKTGIFEADSVEVYRDDDHKEKVVQPWNCN